MSRLIAIGVGAAILVALIGMLAGEARALGQAKEQRNKAIAELAQARVDLEAATRTNAVVTEAHQACMREIETSQDEQWAARGRLTDLEAQVKRSQANVRAERTAIYQLPGCAVYRTLDIGAACPDLVGSLRRRAAEVSAPR